MIWAECAVQQKIGIRKQGLHPRARMRRIVVTKLIAPHVRTHKGPRPIRGSR